MPTFHPKHGTQSWDISPEFEPLLEKILNDPGELVKGSSVRAVTRHAVGDKVFYLKTYFHSASQFAPVKYFFKIPASRAEWHLAPQLQKLGIRVVPHLGHGERWSWRGLMESSLLTEGLPGFVPLTPSHSSAMVQKALGKFLGELHDRSIFHADLHISNLLYSPQTNEFCLVDLDNMEILPKLSDEQRMDNLATLNRRLHLTSDFYKTYGEEYLDRAEKIVEWSENKHRAAIPRQLELLFKSRILFSTRKLGGLKWHVRSNCWNETLESILQQPDEWLARCPRLLKNGTRSTVGSADDLVLKRFNFKKISSVIFDLFRSSRGRRGFRTARHLELLKIAAPRAVAYADRRRFGFLVHSYFVMEKISGADYLWNCADLRPRLLRDLSLMIAKIHNEGFSHRDLKETNLVLDAKGLLHLIDLDAVRYVGKISNRRAAFELTRLLLGFSRHCSISKTERLRFLKIYCENRQIQDWRWWWNKIQRNLDSKDSSR